jgi:hypothetical protein
MASFKVSGLVPMSTAMAGSEVAMTVESMFSMNRAVATMSGIRRSLFMQIRKKTEEGMERGLYHPMAAQATPAVRTPGADDLAVLPRTEYDRPVALSAGVQEDAAAAL